MLDGDWSSDVCSSDLLERYADAYRIELAAFLDALANQKPMPVGAEDGRRALVLAEGAAKSLRTGKPVKL
jgi:myo-inositol 2-dehydrogenase/D-chiro-inositol 1-dehydrogenase